MSHDEQRELCKYVFDISIRIRELEQELARLRDFREQVRRILNNPVGQWNEIAIALAKVTPTEAADAAKDKP